MKKDSRVRPHWRIFASVGGAIAAALCCVVPLVLVSIGIGGAWVGNLTALEPFRPFFIAGAVVLLGYAGYREIKTSTGPACDCDISVGKRTRRSLLLVGAVAVVGLIATPRLIQSTAYASEPRETIGDPRADVRTVSLNIQGMTCTTCALTIDRAVSRLEGISEVHVTYDPPEASVRYDRGLISSQEIIRAIENAGYTSTIKKKPANDG